MPIYRHSGGCFRSLLPPALGSAAFSGRGAELAPQTLFAVLCYLQLWCPAPMSTLVASGAGSFRGPPDTCSLSPGGFTQSVPHGTPMGTGTLFVVPACLSKVHFHLEEETVGEAQRAGVCVATPGSSSGPAASPARPSMPTAARERVVGGEVASMASPDSRGCTVVFPRSCFRSR